MREDNSFEVMLDRIAALGEEEKETVEEAKMIANIIEALSSARIEAGFTQRQLAERCGMNQATLARIESVKVSPRLDTLVHIAYVLKQEISIKSKEEEVSKASLGTLTVLSGGKDPFRWADKNRRSGVQVDERAC